MKSRLYCNTFISLGALPSLGYKAGEEQTAGYRLSAKVLVHVKR
jgi:hypothetical protein